MSGLGELNGSKPMDEIDRTCFHWTRCNRCATIDYGEQCRAEDKSYNFEIDPVTKEITCKGKTGKLSSSLDTRLVRQKEQLQMGDLRVRQRSGDFDETVRRPNDSGQPNARSQRIRYGGAMPEERSLEDGIRNGCKFLASMLFYVNF